MTCFYYVPIFKIILEHFLHFNLIIYFHIFNSSPLSNEVIGHIYTEILEYLEVLKHSSVPKVKKVK